MMVSIMLLPWSNSISGPVSVSTAGNDTDTDMISGSGAGNNTVLDYCGQEEVLASLNENSIRRIPIVVWLVILTILLFFFVGG